MDRIQLWSLGEKENLELVSWKQAFPFGREKKDVVSVIGGGGKTTLLYTLGDLYAEAGKKVLGCTTTHMYQPSKEYWAPDLETLQKIWAERRMGMIGTKEVQTQKIKAPKAAFFRAASSLADLVLAEADGAKHHPCKVPAGHEPVFAENSDWIISVTGLFALYRPLSEVCFRKELACSLLGCSEEHCMTEEDLVYLILSEKGARKQVKGQKFLILLNQCDTKEQQEAGKKILQILKREGMERAYLSRMHPIC